MEWVLEHLNLILVIAGAIAVWLNQRRREKEGMPADYDEDGKADNRTQPTFGQPAGGEPDEAARTRQILEEIRRKKNARAGEPAPTATPPPLIRRVEPTPPPIPSRPVHELPPQVPVRSAAMVMAMEAEVERQRLLAEQLKSAGAMAAAKAQTDLVYATAPAATAAGAMPALSPLVRLRQPGTLREVIVLREVLDPPLALRRE